MEVRFSMTEEENAAFYHQMPMSQEMFDHLAAKFNEMEAEVHFEELLREFPN